jgi:transposase InsO family protein
MAEAFQKQIIYWGYIPSMALVGEPETNGVVERFNRTYKEQVIHGAVFETVRDLQEATRAFAEIYNSSWLLEKLNYQSPLEARMKWSDLAVAI